MFEITDNITKIFALIKYSIRKILFKRRIIIAFLILLTVIAVMGYAGTQQSDRLTTGSDLLGVLVGWFFMPAICMIYGCSVIRDEIEDNSITQIITSPISRTLAYFSYYISLITCLCLITVVIIFLGFISFFAQQGIDGEAINILTTFTGLVILGVFIYSALFLFTSVIFKRPIYFGLFFVFIWEGFIGTLPGSIQKFSFNFYLRSIGSKQLEYIMINEAIDVNTSLIIIFGSIITFIILGSILFKTKEFA
jgi:ABC-2 type transport system permease protein